MGDIAITAAQIAPVDPHKAEIYSFVAAETITKGQIVYLTTAGLAGVADANGAGTVQARGIALNGGGAGQAIDVLKCGRVAGFTVSGMNASAPAFLSNTAGALGTSAGATTVVCGIVTAMSDSDKTKVLYANFRWGPDWA
jgi:hypothetical protein